MFFVLSKVGWFLVQPLAIVFVLAVGGLLAGALRRRRLAFSLGLLSAIALGLAALSPLGLVMANALEERFPRPAPPAAVAGIVVLGGSFDTRVSRSRGEAELNDAADRMTAAAALARRYPDARIVFTGGVAAVFDDDERETVSARAFFADEGIDAGRILYEDRARNTVENAVFTKALAQPKAGEVWLLVTSAFHMPRSVGCFRKAGFAVVPWPVDYRTPGGSAVWRPSTDMTRNVEKFHLAIREYLGLAAYRLTGKTDAFLPGPT